MPIGRFALLVLLCRSSFASASLTVSLCRFRLAGFALPPHGSTGNFISSADKGPFSPSIFKEFYRCGQLDIRGHSRTLVCWSVSRSHFGLEAADLSKMPLDTDASEGGWLCRVGLGGVEW